MEIASRSQKYNYTMTVTVARKTINLGWETATAIVLFLIYNTYAGTKYVINAEADRAASRRDVLEIKAYIKSHTKNDSIYPSMIARTNARIDSLANVNCYIPSRRKNSGTGFVYEFRDKHGNIYTKPVR